MGGPFLSTTLTAQALRAGGTEAQKSQVLPELAAGTPATLALMERHADWDPGHIECRAERRGEMLVLGGRKTPVLDGEAAQWIVTSVRLDGSPALVLLDSEAIGARERRRETVIDETRRSFQLGLEAISGTSGVLYVR